MFRRLLAALGFGLSILLYAPAEGFAQRQVDRDDALSVVRGTDREAREAAQRWATARRLPMRIRQTDGRQVQLVGVVGDRPIYITSLNERAAQITATSTLYPGRPLGLELTGRGMEIGIWDAGHVLSTHQELAGRVRHGDSGEKDNHATHVAGTLSATGIRSEARGMAYEASLLSYDWTSDASEMTEEARRGLLISNHSYGAIAGWYFGDLEGNGDFWYWTGDPTVSTQEDALFGAYGTEAVQFDRAAYDNPYYLPVVAAGNDRNDRGPTSGTYRGLDAQNNWREYEVASRPLPRDGGADGYDTIAGAAVAKNVLTVGSIGTSLPEGSYQASRFSSFGPIDDGRVKPDLVGYGESLLSSFASSSTAYGRSSGTSMATPNVAGTLLLLQQYHQLLRGTSMWSSTLKALAVHTAEDLHHAGPDYQTGWGLLDAEAAADQLKETQQNPLAATESVLHDQMSVSWSVRMDQRGPLRVTVAWTDPPGARRFTRGSAALDDAHIQLRNDLDVRVIDDATGTVHYPWILDPRNPSQPARVGDNVVDPIEQILVSGAGPGTYTIVVSHKASLYGGTSQPFSIIVSGASERLPVAVDRLAAETEVDAVTLTWRTLFELEGGTFAVERAEVNYPINSAKRIGMFEEVGVIALSGEAATPREYRFEDARLLAGHYLYRVVHQNGLARYVAGEIEVLVSAPEQYAVLSNYPNPFHDRTEIVIDLNTSEEVKIEIYDAGGRRVRLVHDGMMLAGRHVLPVDATGWSSGVYFARVSSRSGNVTHHMVVVR